MSIDRSTTHPSFRFFAAGTAVAAALVVTLSPFSLAMASESSDGALSYDIPASSTSTYDETQDQVKAIAAVKEAEAARHAEEARKRAEEEEAARLKAQQEAEAEAATYTYVQASMYGEGDGFMYGTTASGDTVTPTSMAVAMKTMPLGTKIQLTYNGTTVTAVVNDRGPYVAGREIDLQPAVAHALGFSGVGTVGYKVVDE